MRFLKIVVKNFQAIERAEVDLGPGLNILFGPNDLGKSTLACAIRAALLVPPSSTEASRYLPWFADAVPEVSLTFADDDNRFWRVRKCYGAASAQTSADLYHSKDGVAFSRDCGGREVEEQLRTLLGWGIPAPGGKGAPKKLPTSFLAHVLLAEQTQVETILAQSLAQDGATSGRDRLRAALAALAEDPWFKKVLTETQTRVEAFFSPTGQRKRGRGSPFALAAEDVKRRAARVEELKRSVADSRAVEEHVQELQEQFTAACEAWDDAKNALAIVYQRRTRATERARAAEKLEQAKAALDALDRQALHVADRTQAVKALEAAATAAEAQVIAAHTETERAEAALRGAEDALRAATSEDGAHQREVARAKLGEERAQIGEKTRRVENRLDALESAQKAAASASAANRAKADADIAAKRALSAEESSKSDLTEAEKDFELARGILAYGLWYAAEGAAKHADETKNSAEALRTDAAKKDDAASQKDAQAAAIEADAETRRESLPDPALTRRLEELEHQITVTEAALGGGFSLVLRGSGKVPVHVAVDGSEAVAGTALDGRFLLDAERTASLRVGEVLEVEVFAGAADKRRALEALRERWTNEALPVLERAGVNTLVSIRERAAEVAGLRTTVDALRADARQLRTEAAAARDSANMKEQRAGELLVQAREVESLKAKFATLDQQVLAASFAKLGAAWKEQAESLIGAKEKALARVRERLQKETLARELADYRVTEAEKLMTTAAVDSQTARAAVGLGESAEGVEADQALDRALEQAGAELTALRSRHAALEEQLRALDEEASTTLTAAKASLEEASTRRDRSVDHRAQATKALEDARTALDTAHGEADALRKALESADRVGAETRVAEARMEFEAYSNDLPVSPDQVLAAERTESEAKAKLDHVRAELNQAEGALTKVGGIGVREELAREEEAHALANERQRELEIDADAWKLLRETLDEVEKEGSAHLGRSLAAPVTARLAELTQGRYGALRIDQHLKAETVEVPSLTTAENVLDALSVGTRGQIATLLRLTVAEQLKSAIILDDHLVHTDPERLAWFRDTLRRAALTTQVIVLTCRPQDYLTSEESAFDGVARDLAGGTTRAVNVARVMKRFADAPIRSASSGPVEHPDAEVTT